MRRSPSPPEGLLRADFLAWPCQGGVRSDSCGSYPRVVFFFDPGRSSQKSLMGSLVSRSAKASARAEVPGLLTSCTVDPLVSFPICTECGAWWKARTSLKV